MTFRLGARRVLWGRTVVMGLSLLAAGACSRDQPPGPARSGEQPLQITRNFTTTESDSGVVRYVVRARIARFYANDVTRAEDVTVDFYDQGQKVSVLNSKEGFLDDDGRLRAKGQVVVRAVEGGILETDELYWDREAGKIRTDGPFRITEKGDVLSGVGLTTTPNLDLIETENELSGDHSPGKKP